VIPREGVESSPAMLDIAPGSEGELQVTVIPREGVESFLQFFLYEFFEETKIKE
jgi:hypothetical protein